MIGAASGIGEAIARGLAAHGARVVALDVKPGAARGIGLLDITDSAAVDGVIETPLTAPIKPGVVRHLPPPRLS